MPHDSDQLDRLHRQAMARVAALVGPADTELREIAAAVLVAYWRGDHDGDAPAYDPVTASVDAARGLLLNRRNRRRPPDGGSR